jgi:hypothetical protein
VDSRSTSHARGVRRKKAVAVDLAIMDSPICDVSDINAQHKALVDTTCRSISKGSGCFWWLDPNVRELLLTIHAERSSGIPRIEPPTCTHIAR